MYEAVPIIVPVEEVSEMSTSLAMPKSTSRARSPEGMVGSRTRMMFSGLRSRWITPAAWVAASTLAICVPIAAARGAENTPRWRRRRSVSPSRYSMTRKARPLGVKPTSKIWPTPGWRIRPAASAWWKKRSTCSRSSEMSGSRSLIATRVWTSACSASQTSPMPPLPRRATISKLPIVSPITAAREYRLVRVGR
jgi:hypothetical protein